MCGIAGFSHFSELGIDIRDTIHLMTSALMHRGPDDHDTYIDQAVALGSRRLSIIDVANGKMPLHNEDKSLWIVFNGEIYNFPELREELLQKGHCFSTNTDTEVILHLYEDYGTECVTKLNGMFAFALWDIKNQSLFLARDRLGIKPLHYIEYPGGLVFASEIKAILKHPMIEARLDYVGVSKYLTYEYVPAPHCILQGFRKLEPGHWLLQKITGVTLRQ